MSKDIEKYGDERAAEGKAEGRAEGKAEGRTEGKIIGAIDFARKMKMTDKQIEDYLMENFKLTREEAQKYLEPVYA